MRAAPAARPARRPSAARHGVDRERGERDLAHVGGERLDAALALQHDVVAEAGQLVVVRGRALSRTRHARRARRRPPPVRGTAPGRRPAPRPAPRARWARAAGRRAACRPGPGPARRRRRRPGAAAGCAGRRGTASRPARAAPSPGDARDEVVGVGEVLRHRVDHDVSKRSSTRAPTSWACAVRRSPTCGSGSRGQHARRCCRGRSGRRRCRRSARTCGATRNSSRPVPQPISRTRPRREGEDARDGVVDPLAHLVGGDRLAGVAAVPAGDVEREVGRRRPGRGRSRPRPSPPRVGAPTARLDDRAATT